MTNTTSTHQPRSAHDSRQQRREAELALAAEVMDLLKRSETEGLLWRGTQTDLMEALHTAYATGRITDEYGYALSFVRIVGRVCSLLHLRPPRNPYHYVSSASRRKGIVSHPYMERYELMLYRSNNPRPLGSEIKNF